MKNPENTILFLSKREEIFKSLTELLGADKRFRMVKADPTPETLSGLSEAPPLLIISTLINPGFDWREVLLRSKKGTVPAPVIFMDGHELFNEAIEAIREGAYDFVVHPWDPKSALLRIQAAMGHRQLQEKVHELQRELRFRRNSDFIVGDSLQIQGVLGKILRISDSDVPVMISGESGTGKELVARAIHYNSRRSEGPFIVVNCSAIPETLIENELFGHEKGSFTGADREKRGLFEEANEGTLFLDEIAELTPTVQAKLLNVLEKGEFRRVGGLKIQKTDIRLISATNRNLDQEIEEGRFRDDLYYRINVFPIKIPPLRDRRGDIPQIANHFLRIHSPGLNKKVRGFSPSAIQKLMFYSWPGNVRELGNKIRQAMIVADRPVIYREDIQLDRKDGETRLKTFKEAKAEFEKNYLMNLLRITNGNVSEAARLAGKDRKDFYDVMRKHKIYSKDFRIH